MKTTLIALLALVVAAGCGKKEPELRSEKVITPDEAANQLFVEAIELVRKAKSEENTNIPAAIKSYEEALVKVRKIVNEYKKSDLAVKLVSGETLFTGKSMEQIEERVGELQRELTRRAEEEKRRAEQEKRRAEEMRKARAKHLLWEFETGSGVDSSPAIGSDGTVYFGSGDGKIYALQTSSKGLAKSPWPMRGQNPLHTGRVMKK
jgi:hypothetical protein